MKTSAIVLLNILIATLSAGGGYWWAHQADMKTVSAAPMESAPSLAPAKKKVLYWYDPMVPNQQFGKPGKSPFMDMDLVPKYGDDNVISAGIAIDSGLQQNMALRRAKVERKVLRSSIEVAGSLMYNARDVAVVQARSGGFVERVYAHAPGDVVAANAPLVDLLMPEWAAAQSEFLALRRHDDPSLTDAARQRLILLGMPATLITAIEKSGQPKSTFTLRTPIAGVIQTLEVRQGMTITTGTTLATVNGISTVWLDAAVPETYAAMVGKTYPLKAHFSAYPDEEFCGSVIALLPETNAQTRTLKVRAEFPNPEGRLRPGMYARVEIETGERNAQLWIPTEAVIRTGKRDVVILEQKNNAFVPQEITIGEEIQEKTAVLSGLKEGQTVVVSGQFLLDSEASLAGLLHKLDKEDPAQSDDNNRIDKAGETP